jgi:hypothetical protein
MGKEEIDASVWANKLTKLIQRTTESGAAMRYSLHGLTLVASGCQVSGNGQTIWTVPKPTKSLGLGDSALGVTLPDADLPHAHWYLFEDHQGGIYLAVEIPLCGYRPQPMARLELATSQELLDSEVNSPLVH